ncbi:MAG TPA: hypothetical protein VMT20_13680 [Terriglobia bacterium]|nr:hypothetical protein [Terriglobia bacterium]
MIAFLSAASIAVNTSSRPETLRNGAHHSTLPRSTRQPSQKSQNSKSYQRTRQPIENKGQEISNPVNLLMAGSLASLSRQGIENTPFTSEKQTIKNSNPVNLLKLNKVNSAYLVNSLKNKARAAAISREALGSGRGRCRSQMKTMGRASLWPELARNDEQTGNVMQNQCDGKRQGRIDPTRIMTIYPMS